MTPIAAVPEPSVAALPKVVADLLLVRLLIPTKQPLAPSRARKDLARFLDQEPPSESFQELIDRLRNEDVLEERGLRLTETGQKRALAFLGVDALPSKCNWQTLQARYLVPLALGLNPTAEDTAKKIDKQEKLAALLLKRKFNLPTGVGQTLGAVFEALACQKLGFPDVTDLKALKTVALNRMLGTAATLDEKQLATQLPRVLLKTKQGGMSGLRDVVLRGWLAEPKPSAVATEPEQEDPVSEQPADEEFDLTVFARTVTAAARECPTGRFGDNKVFINHVWRRLAEEPSFAGMGLAEFKQRLVEANTANLLTLSRADLVPVMDPEDVRDSETPYLNAVFHFILIEEDRP